MNTLTALLAAREPIILGVLNVTPDSFSDGGLFSSRAAAIAQIGCLLADGAHLVDVGGESTAPGSKPISAEEEWHRVAPCFESAMSKGRISIDTYKSQVAARALALGAVLINDVSALRADPEMASVVAHSDAHVVLMHSKEAAQHPHASDTLRNYDDVVAEVSEFLLERATYAVKNGIKEDRILLDPGMGRFLSHDPRYSWELLSRYDELCSRLQPFPVCVATSRKGFLGGALTERDPTSQLTALHALQRGAAVARTHHPRLLREFLEIAHRLRSTALC